MITVTAIFCFSSVKYVRLQRTTTDPRSNEEEEDEMTRERDREIEEFNGMKQLFPLFFVLSISFILTES